MTRVRSVAVAGSCLTRDAFNGRFNPSWRDHFDVRLASNQTSMVALMSPPITEPFTPTRELNDYNLWNVRSDLTRELLGLLPQVRPDVLLVDFFADVWFGVAQLPDGRYLTDNRWKTHHTDLYQDHLARGELRLLRHQDDPDAYVELWAESLDRFAAHVRATSPQTRVVVHRGWVTDRVVVPGRPRPQPLARHSKARRVDVPLFRDFWARLDDHALATYDWECLDLRELRTPTHVDHAWGPFYVHFLDEYYHRFLADLLRLTVAEDLSPQAQAVIDLTAAAVQEPWQRHLETERGVVATLRARLEASEPAPAARPRLGRRIRRRIGRAAREAWRRGRRA